MGFYNNTLPAGVTQPGVLDRRATLRSRSDAADALGQPIPTWTDTATVFALWQPESGSEQQASKSLEPLLTGTLRIRYRSDIDSSWRVLLGTVLFELTAPPIEVGRRAFLDLKLRSLTKAAP